MFQSWILFRFFKSSVLRSLGSATNSDGIHAVCDAFHLFSFLFLTCVYPKHILLFDQVLCNSLRCQVSFRWCVVIVLCLLEWRLPNDDVQHDSQILILVLICYPKEHRYETACTGMYVHMYADECELILYIIYISYVTLFSWMGIVHAISNQRRAGLRTGVLSISSCVCETQSRREENFCWYLEVVITYSE